MTMRLAGVALAAVLACGWASGAQAATVTQTYNFDAFFSTGPLDEVTGSFTATFDPTSAQQGPIALNAFSSTLGTAYEPAFISTSGNTAEVGNDCVLGSCGINRSSQFLLGFFINDAGFSTGGFSLIYTDSSNDAFFSTRTMVVSAVPLPSSAPLFSIALLGLGALGYSMKRRTLPQAI